MNHMGTLTLETERLILRPFILQDAPSMFANWANDPEVTKFLTWKPHGSVENSRTLLRDWIRQYPNRFYYQWCIVLKSGNVPIGSIGVVNNLDETSSSATIGYCIGKDWWHQGYTSEAFACIIEYLFERVGIKTIDSYHDILNPNSGKVMQKCGMTFIGTQQKKLEGSSRTYEAAMYRLDNPRYK